MGYCRYNARFDQFSLFNPKGTRTRQSCKTKDHKLGIYTKQFQSRDSVAMGAYRNSHDQMKLQEKTNLEAAKMKNRRQICKSHLVVLSDTIELDESLTLWSQSRALIQ